MSGYDFDNDSHAGDPVLVGVTGDSCGTCPATDVPLYDLSCHATDDFYCRDCLTKKWVAATDDVVLCPACGNDCDFMPLKPIEEFSMSRKFNEMEVFDKICEQPEVMNNKIGFTNREAAMFLQLIYGLVEDQILDPTELGGVPSHEQAAHKSDPGSTSVYSFMSNPFFLKFHEGMTAAPKMMTSPLQLEEDLLKLLDNVSIDYVKFKHGATMIAGGVDLSNDEWVLQQASFMYQDVKEVRGNWQEIVKLWVVLLAWGHLERTAPVEGGAAERFRIPVSLP